MHELARKMPATVIDTRPLVTMTAPYHQRAVLIAEVNRLARAGDIRPQAARPAYNPARGDWEILVLRLRPERPAWHRPAAIIGAGLAMAGALFAIAIWLISSLAATPLALFLLAVLGALTVLLRMGRSTVVQVTTSTTVRVRR